MADPSRPGRAPMTEEEIRAAWVTEPPRLVGRIEVADYDPAWPRLFQREADRIRSVRGKRLVQLEHVGSTSVPGPAAKPIIDILLVVPDSGDEPTYVPELEAAGYLLVLRARMGPAPGVQGAGHQRQPARVLAWQPGDRALSDLPRPLRSDPADRARYQRVKRELAQRDWRYVQQYADAKTEVVEEIIARAQRQAGEGGAGSVR